MPAKSHYNGRLSEQAFYPHILEHKRKVNAYRRKWEAENKKREEVGLPLLSWPLGLSEWKEEQSDTIASEKLLKSWEHKFEMENRIMEKNLIKEEENEQRLMEINEMPLDSMTDSQRITRHNLMLARIGFNRKIDITSDCQDDMLNRFQEYLAICVQNKMNPTIEGYYVSCGISSSEVGSKVRSGKSSSKFDETLTYIKQILCSQLVDNANNSKGNPIMQIFQLRNNYGYTNDDKMNAEREIRHERREETAAEELAEKYANLPD